MLQLPKPSLDDKISVIDYAHRLQNLLTELAFSMQHLGKAYISKSQTPVHVSRGGMNQLITPFNK